MSVLMLSGLVYMLNMGLSPLQQQLLLLYLKFEKLSATSYLKEEKINTVMQWPTRRLCTDCCWQNKINKMHKNKPKLAKVIGHI